MSLKIKELPETERPYEKMELYGENSLSDAELLAIIIKSGTKDETSVQIAQKILNLSDYPQMSNLNFLRDLSIQELMQVKGVGKVKAIQIKAVCELAIRMSRPSNYKKIKIKSTEDAANLISEEMRFEKKECVKVILLNNKNEVLKTTNIASGGTNFVNMNMKELIWEALKIKAPRMILIHNHPSGDATPSNADIHFTDKLYNAAKMFDIELLDHIVIGSNDYKSVFVETKNVLKTKG